MRTRRSWLGLVEALVLAGLSASAGAQPVGSEFQINTYTTSSQASPSLASDASGNFVVFWSGSGQDGSGYGIFGQRYDNLGGAQGNEFQINSFTNGAQQVPSAVATGTNRFVVAWQSDGQDGSGLGVFGQRYDFSGGGPTIHVGDLDRKAKDVEATWRAQVKALVHNDNHLAESGVLVTFNVS